MIMICGEHLVPSIGEKIDGDMHSTHNFISICQYCFTADMVSWTEKQNVFRSSLCHFPIPKECTIFWKYPISESAPVSWNINLWWQLPTENMKMNASFLKKSTISKNHHKFYFSVHLTSYTNLMSHFSRAFINYFPNMITLSKQWI